jgi:hypothetical protein
LFAITDDAECGIMQAMTTISHNDNCADLLAVVRRGPGARPTEEEFIEYLLSRKKRSQERPPIEHYAFEHVLSYQRRVTAIKTRFMRRGKTTPLGCIRDWWDCCSEHVYVYAPPTQACRDTDAHTKIRLSCHSRNLMAWIGDAMAAV